MNAPPPSASSTFTQEIALVTGPLLIAALIGFGPGVGLITAATIGGVATVGFAALGTTEATTHEASARTGGGRATPFRRCWRSHFCWARCSASFRSPRRRWRSPAASPQSAASSSPRVSVGGISGAVLYGAIRWRADPATRLILLLALLAVATTALLAVLPLAAVGALLAVGGLALNPAFATTSLLHRSPRWCSGRRGLRMDVNRAAEEGPRRRRGRGSARAAQRLSTGVLRRCRRGYQPC